jgi:hypothetical protein
MPLKIARTFSSLVILMRVNYRTISKCKCGAAVENWDIAGYPRILLDRSPPVILCFLKAWRVKRQIMFLQFFRQVALCHISVNGGSINLRAIENCICGLRCIERKMRSILQTVWHWNINQVNLLFSTESAEPLPP